MNIHENIKDLACKLINTFTRLKEHKAIENILNKIVKDIISNDFHFPVDPLGNFSKIEKMSEQFMILVYLVIPPDKADDDSWIFYFEEQVYRLISSELCQIVDDVLFSEINKRFIPDISLIIINYS